MKTKICSLCKTEKPIELFAKNRTKKDGYMSWCIECRRKKDAERDKTKKRKNQKKIWAKNNKEKTLLDNYDWKNKNREKYNKRRRELSAIKKGFFSLAEYEQNILNKKIESENKKIEKQKEKEKIRDIKRQEKIRLKELKRIADNEKRKEQRKVDLQYKLTDNLRARTRKILRIQSANKTTNMAKLIGCSGKELADRFISMGYDSNTCHIDHIIPMSVFDLTIPEHQYVACHYLNLQPLNITENLIKHDSLIDNWQDKIKEICLAVGINSDSIIKHISNKQFN